MKRIIIPYDFSELANVGLKLAILLANYSGAKIDMVYVVPQHHDKAKVDTKKLKKQMEEIAAANEAENVGIKIECKVKEGKIYEEIVYEAEKYKDSVIVTSTHGASGWEEFFIGTNAYKIVASSLRPVFTIKGTKLPKQIKKIVLPIDISLESRGKIPFTAILAKETGADVNIVTVSTTDMPDIIEKLNRYAGQVSDYLNKYTIKNSIDNLVGDNLTDITIEYAKKIDADLTSIMSEQDNNIKNLLLGNNAHQMINKSNIPVLIIPSRHIGIINDGFRAEGISF